MKRMYVALLALLAIGAFGVAASAAQAQPYWLHCVEVPKGTGSFDSNQCNSKVGELNWEWKAVGPEPEELEVLTYFSALTLEASNGVSITCKGHDAGFIWNDYEDGVPVQGLDEITAFVNESCASESCPDGVTVTAEGLSWATELALVGGVLVDNITGIQVHVVCSGVFEATFKGDLSPEINAGNGTTEFNPGAGSLAGPDGLTASVTGDDTLKGQGGEAIEIDDP